MTDNFNNSKILEIFHAGVFAFLDEKGVFPHNGVLLDKEGKTECLAMDLHPEQVYKFIKDRFSKGGVIELVFGLDRYSLPGQAEFSDLVSVHYWDGFFWHFGIIEYKYISDTEKIVKPIDWQNTYWIPKLGQEHAQYFPESNSILSVQ